MFVIACLLLRCMCQGVGFVFVRFCVCCVCAM